MRRTFCMPRLIIQSPGQAPLLFELVRERVTVGRSERNDLVLDDANVSRFHAELELTAEGYRIRDLQSRNGIWVGEGRVPAACLKDGTSVRLGDTTLRFEESAPGWEHTVMVEKSGPVELDSTDQQGLVNATIAFKEVSQEPTLPKTVPELQQQLAEVRRRALLFEIISRIRRLLHTANSPQEMLSRMPSLVFNATRAERVLVTTWDEEKQCLRPATIHTAPGAPLAISDDGIRAVECAIEMQSGLAGMSRQWHLPAIWMGIGVNSGEVIAGNIGSPERMEYTVIGDTVNVAARLTASAKPGEILVGESTFHQIEGQIPVEPLPPQPLKGKREPVPVFRVLESVIGVEAGM